jgi:hypothetical protein
MQKYQKNPDARRYTTNGRIVSTFVFKLGREANRMRDAILEALRVPPDVESTQKLDMAKTEIARLLDDLESHIHSLALH